MTPMRAFLYMAAIIVILCAALLSLGCGSNTPTPTTPTPSPVTTGTLHLTNTSTAILNVYWDGRYLAQLAPGAIQDFANTPIGPHSISWEAIEQDWWQLSLGGQTAVFCLGPNNTIRQCNGRTVCQSTMQIAAGVSSTAAPCAFDARPSCTTNNTSVLLLANTSTHDDDILVDRIDRGIMHPTTDPTNVQSGDLAAFVVPPGSHHLDFLHYPPPRWNACVDVSLTVNSCQVLAYSCQY